MFIAAKAHVCTDLYQVWQILGWILTVFKIVIPVIIIIFGVIDLGKAVVASKDDEIKKSVKTLAIRAIAGIIIFFIPTLVGLIFNIVGSFNELKDEYAVCSYCINHPGKCQTQAGTRCTGGAGNLGDSGCTAGYVDDATLGS